MANYFLYLLERCETLLRLYEDLFKTELQFIFFLHQKIYSFSLSLSHSSSSYYSSISFNISPENWEEKEDYWLTGKTIVRPRIDEDSHIYYLLDSYSLN